jgi:ABC-type phosphate transport system substrate-binding protein
MKRLLVTLAIALTLPAFAAKPISIKGSDTMVIMNARLAETFMARQPGTMIQVTGGGSGVGIAAVKKDAKSPAVTPSLETVRSGQYPISRYLYLYTRVKPSKEMKAFLDWATGPEGQDIVTKVGYFPVE